jgi:hypothetical protein
MLTKNRDWAKDTDSCQGGVTQLVRFWRNNMESGAIIWILAQLSGFRFNNPVSGTIIHYWRATPFLNRAKTRLFKYKLDESFFRSAA